MDFLQLYPGGNLHVDGGASGARPLFAIIYNAKTNESSGSAPDIDSLIIFQNFDATEMVEMDVASRVGSAGSGSTLYFRQVPPRLDRLGSDMSGGSDALPQPGGLRRTAPLTATAVNTSAKAPPGSSGGSTIKPVRDMVRKLYMV